MDMKDGMTANARSAKMTDVHISAEDYRNTKGAKPKRNKYNAQRTEYGGRVYDSKKEAAFAADLALLQKEGEIVSAIPQVSIPLFPPSSGLPVKKRTYRADFLEILETFPDGSFRARLVDVKGRDTRESKLKREIVTERYKVEVILR